MKKNWFLIFCTFCFFTISAQDVMITIKGEVQNAADNTSMANVSIININTIKGAITNSNGEFEIDGRLNDTLYFSFIGFKPFKARVTNDWINYGNIIIKLTELGFALEEVVVSSHGLTGFLEIDANNIPTYQTNTRYAIPGLETSYEGGNSDNAVNRSIKALLNPISSIANLFNKKKNQLKRLRRIKEDEEIRNLLQDKFDRETLTTLLGVEKVDIDQILSNCNYSKQFIKTANDLQIMDAISECYEEYKILNR